MIHSGVFMGSISLGNLKELWIICGATVRFYSLFALAITIAFESWYFLITYSAIMMARWQGMLKGGKRFFNESVARSGVSIVNLLFAALLVAMVPVPRLGITNRVLSLNPTDATGAWIDHPEYALAFGVIYFFLMAVYEWLATRYKLRVASPDRAAVVTG